MKFLFQKLNLKVVAVLSVVFLLTLVILPRVASHSNAEVCNQVYDNAVLNPFEKVPMSDYYSGMYKDDCRDFPTLAIRNVNSSKFESSLSANSGEEFYVQLYVHNGGRQDFGDANTARNIRAQFSKNGGSLSVNVTGQDNNGMSLNSLYDSVSLNLPSGASMEVIPGTGEVINIGGGSYGVNVDDNNLTLDLGDQQACFQYARFIRFKVRVIAPAVQEQPSGNITAAPTNRLDGQCMYNGLVSWNTKNVESVLVTVTDESDSVTNDFSRDLESNGTETPWLTPDHYYVFNLYDISDGTRKPLDSSRFQVPSLNCGTTPVVVSGENYIRPQVEVTNYCPVNGVFDGYIRWTTKTDVQSALVTVDDLDDESYNNGNESVMSYATQGEQSIPWLTPDHRYMFKLYDTTNGQKLLAQDQIRAPKLNCGTTTTPKDGIITLNISNERVGNLCQLYGTVKWNTSNVDNVKVYVKNNNKETLFGQAESYEEKLSWFTPGEYYRFTLIGDDGFTRNTGDVKAPDLNCGTTPPPTAICPSGYVSVSSSSILVNGTVSLSASGFSGGTFTSSNNSVLSISGNTGRGVSAGVVYISGSGFTASNGATNCSLIAQQVVVNNQTVVNPNPVQNVTATATATASATASAKCGDGSTATASASASASASATASTYDLAYSQAMGQAQSKATADAQAKASAQVTCGPTPEISNPVYCSPTNQTVLVGQAAGFTATGGNGNFSWTAYGSNQNFGSGSSFSTTYSSPGNYSVSVSSNGKFASCNVQVNPTIVPPPAQLICSPSSQTVTTGQTTYFTATGGNGAYSWNASGSNNTSGSGVSFTTSYANSGSKTVTVTSGSQTANCNVNVNEVNPQTGILQINKLVKNISQGGSFSQSVSVNAGNRVAYQITVTALNNTVNNVVLNENLPSYLNLSGGTVTLDSNSVSDSSINSINLGSMSAGQTKTLYFEATANASGSQCQSVITNTATASGSGTASVSSSATVYVNQQNCGGGGYGQLNISKTVKNSTSGNYYSESVNAQNGDRVQFEIVVRNNGNQTVNNVRVRDYWNSGLTLVYGSVYVEGGNYGGNNIIDNDLSIGSLNPGQQKRITLEATVSANGGASIQNTARASGDGVSSVTDDAWVFVNNNTYNPCPYGCVSGGNVNLSFQKRAVNETKNADATSVAATREDYITYTLTVSNNGNAPANNFVITDDLSGVLAYADVTDKGGGEVSGNVITFPGITVPAYGSVSRSFKVRVKYNLAQNGSYTMNNTYGNTVSIRINNPTPVVLGAFVAPTTGANTAGIWFSGLLTIAFAIYKKRETIMSLLA